MSEVIYSSLLPVKESKPKVEKHKWGERKSTFRSNRARCQKCGMERDAKSDGSHYWVEYRMDGCEWEKKDRTPACQPYATVKMPALEAAANAKGWFWNGNRWEKIDERGTHNNGG